MEIFKTNEALGENYLISNKGNVKSLSRYKDNNGGKVFVPERILKQQTTRKGYLVIRITINRKSKSLVVHRLVAKSFIPNEEFKEQVNHIDGNKKNNNIENLEWCSGRENINHYRKSKIHSSKHVGVHFYEKTNKYITQIRINRKTLTLGSFNCEDEAKSVYENVLKNWKEKGVIPELNMSSKYRNISFNKTRRKWHLYNMENGKYKTIGFFITEEEARNKQIENDKK